MRLLAYFLCLAAMMMSCSTKQESDSASGKAPVLADNISNQFVYTIAEDATGQIWIGTFRGLNRYNSREFFQYFSHGDSLSLPDNQIRTIHRSKDGTLYIGTIQGLCRYTDQDNFVTIDIGGRPIVSNIVEMDDSSLIFTANKALMGYKPGDKKASLLLDDNCPGSFFCNNLHCDDNNQLWIVGENTIRRYDSFRNVLADSIAIGMYCTNSFMFNGHEMWLTGPNLRCFDTHLTDFVSLPKTISSHPVLSSASIELVHPYGAEGMMFLTSNDGMFLYNASTGKIISQNDADFPIKVPEFKIKTMFTDSRGNIWFGGHDQGIDVHYKYTDRFNHNKTAKTAVDNKSVVSTTIDRNNNLWMATRNDGIFMLDNRDKSICHFPVISLSSRGHAYDEYIKNVFADSKGYIWITLTNSEVLRCKPSDGGLGVDKRYNIWGVMSITEDANGTIWLGTGSPYVAYLKPDASEFVPLQVFDPGFVFIPGLTVYDNEHILVAAFNQPPKTVDINTKEVSPLPVADKSLEKSLTRSVFIPTDVFVDNCRNLWIGTIANGLLRYDKSDSTFVAIKEFDGFDVSAIRQDRDSCLWVSTLNGLCRYCPGDEYFEHFMARDGIGGNQFYDRAAAVDTSGYIYFGATHGITSFDPREVSQTVSAPLLFQNLIVHNKAVRPGTGIIDTDMQYCPDVHLDNDKNSFGITFVAVDYCMNPRVPYRYMLEGVDDRWIESSGSRVAYYANVAPGTYHFKVGIVGDDSSQITIKVIIEGPWWTSWWAIIIICIIIASISAVLIVAVMKVKAEREAVHRARLEKEREQHINDMNMRFFANISHEFRTPLTMISGPIKQLAADKEISEQNRHLLTIAKVNVSRMLNLVNQLLDFNKLENDTLPLEVERIDIAALLRQLTEMFSLHAANKELTFVTNGMEENCFVTADADKLSKIITNLLSNALKFTPRGGTVTVGLDIVHDSEIGEAIKIYVRNTGNRIPSDKLEKIFERYYQLDNNNESGSYNCGSGIGLYYSRALANLHHGRLFAVDSKEFNGAEFDLIIPAQAEVYANDRHKGSPTQFDTYPLSSPPGGVSPMGADTSDTTSRPLILVVDDDIQVAEYLRTLLQSSYRVVNRFDAESALSWLDENTPAMIISDVVMPGKDGYDLCRFVKRDIRFSHIPVILLTAKATVENQVEGLDAEADAYITKPFEPSLLMSQIGSLLRNREKAMKTITAVTTVEDVDADIISPQDSAFLEELYALMEKELANCELDVNEISRLIHMSRTKFYYKVKGLTGEPPSVFFKTYKLNRAAELIREHRYTLSEISDMTGFSSLSHFSRSFKKQFGVPPTSFS